MATNTNEREEIKPVAPTEQTKWRDPSLVGKYMVDPKTGLAGLFRSPDNGETWVLTDTVYGHVYNQDEVDNIWDNGAGHKVADEIKSATADLPNVRKQADSAVKFAESAIAASKVNSDAIVAQSSAVVEAKSAMDSATAEIQQLKANAASDVAQIRADVAQVQNEVDTAKSANSASVDKLKSDIGLAQKGLDNVHDSLIKAQSAVEQNQKLINDSVAKINSDIKQDRKDMDDTRTQLSNVQAAVAKNRQDLESNVTKINNDIAKDRKDITEAQQANADTAKKLDSYTKQAIEQGKTIKDLQTDDDSTKLTIADIKGNVSQVQDSVTGLTASLKDANDNLATVKALADSLSATLTDHGKNIASLQATAKELSSTLGDADGRLSKVEQTAEEQSTTLSTVQGNLSQVKQTADSLTDTLKDAQGDIAKVQATAKGLSEQITNAQGDITNLQTDVTGIKATIADHDKNIHTLQADAKSLTDDMTDAQGNISKLQKTATDLTSEMQDHDGRISKVEQTAEEHSSTFSDLQGNLSQVKQTATDLVTTLKDAQGNIDQLQRTTKGTTEQISSLNGDITSLQKDVNGIKLTIADHDKNIHTLQADSKSLHDNMKDAQGNISSLQKTATSLDSEFKDHDGRLSKVEQTANTLTNEFSDQQGHLNRVEQTAQGTQQTVANQQGQINTIKTDASGIHETLTGQGNQIANINATLGRLSTKYEGVSGDLGKLKNSAMQNRGTVSAPDFNSLTAAGFYTITAPSEGKNYPTGSWGTLEVSGQTSDSNGRLNQKYVSDNNAETYVRQYNATTKSWTAWIKTANQNDVTALSNRITTNSTQITQNKQAIALKADQTTVDNLSGEVSQNKAQLKVQADQISSKVSSTDFKTLNDKVNGMKIGGRNLLQGTAKIDFPLYNNGGTQTIEKYDDETNYIQHTSKTPINRMGPWWLWTPEIGQIYTMSADVCGNGYIQGGEFHYEGGDEGNLGRIDLTNDWQRISNTFRVNVISGNWVIYANNSTLLKVKHIKIEKGNVATDWTPAPEDLTTAIQKNGTAIDQTNKQISLKADQTEVDKVKGTASQNSSRLDVMNNEINSKVSSTDVNNIVDSKGYATTSTVQSLITQKAGTINESITNLTSKINSNNGGGVNLQGETDACSFPIGNNGNTTSVETYSGSTKMIHAKDGGFYTSYDARSFVPTPGETYTLSADVKGDGNFDGSLFRYEGGDNGNLGTVNLTNNWRRVSNTVHVNKVSGQWVFYVRNSKDYYVKHIKIERGSVATPWTPAPSDNATVTQVQQITASIDGLQSTVSNKADKSQITQLSNVIQSKVSTDDFNNLRKAVDLQTLDSADINNMKTNGHYFVHNLTNSPIAGWVYVDVTGNGNDRIRQDVYQDGGNQHKYRRWFGTYWTGWEEGATYTEITQLQDAVNLRVQKGELLSQINLTAGNTLIQSNKLYLDASSVVFSGRAFIPSAAISELDADKLTFYGNGSKASIGAGIAQYDQDKIKSTINLQYQGGFEIHSSNQLGSILTMHDNTVRLAVKSNGMANPNSPTDQYSGFYASTSYSLMNSYLKDGTTSGISIGSTDSGVNKDYRIHVYDGSNASNNLSKGISISTSSRFDVYAGNSQLFLGPDKAELRGNDHATVHGNDHTFIEGGNQQIYMHNGEVNIGNPNDTGNATGVHLRVFGWASFNGYVEGMGWTTKSTLSSKTRIEKLDTKDALNKIMETDLETYQYKAEVAGGMTKRHAGPIIDDVHDVAQYSTPDEFINERRTGRSDADVIGYLMGAVQELKKQLDEMKKEVQING